MYSRNRFLSLSTFFIACNGFPLNAAAPFTAKGANGIPTTKPSVQLHVSSTTDESDLTTSTLTIDTDKVHLSSGVAAEVMTCIPPGARKSGKPPLVFIHGSFHAAWCWTENYFPYFAARDYPVTALSLRGTGGTFAGEGVKKVKIAEHVGDISAFLDYISSKEGLGLSGRPVLLSHSFGGLAVMKYIEKGPSTVKDLGGIVMLCSVPPSGNSKMTLRYLKRSLADSWKITAGLAMKKCMEDPILCRTLFFGGDRRSDDMGVSDEDIERYQSYFRRDTVATIDLGDLSRQLPSAKVDENGRANFASSLPATLVAGAKDDFIVDNEGVEETARFLGVEPVIVDSPHDVMLGRNWRSGADVILNWLEEEANF